jgi:hypothetical protein
MQGELNVPYCNGTGRKKESTDDVNHRPQTRQEEKKLVWIVVSKMM